jgi:hypothetical protein
MSAPIQAELEKLCDFIRSHEQENSYHLERFRSMWASALSVAANLGVCLWREPVEPLGASTILHFACALGQHEFAKVAYRGLSQQVRGSDASCTLVLGQAWS